MHKSLIALTLASSGFAASQNCSSDPVPCNRDTCAPCYCAGPADVIANAPVYPRTCEGDFHIEASVLYWKATQDGMEYAFETSALFQDEIPLEDFLIDANYHTPAFKNNFGMKFGVGYRSKCDGWGIDFQGNYFKGRADSHNQSTVVERTLEENSLLSIWSAFHGIQSSLLSSLPFVSDIVTCWSADISWLDLTLSRSYWVSKHLNLCPILGLRGAKIAQDFRIKQSGGVFIEVVDGQAPLNDEVDLQNDFHGLGILGGLAGNWHFGCGWSFYSKWAVSSLYGRFDIEHDEAVREAESPFSKSKVLETTDKFRASRGVLDFILGIEYASLICDCQYGITARLAWEQHLFFHQNQLFRVSRVGNAGAPAPFPNNSGENFIDQSRGTLSTGGLTFTFGFDF